MLLLLLLDVRSRRVWRQVQRLLYLLSARCHCWYRRSPRVRRLRQGGRSRRACDRTVVRMWRNSPGRMLLPLHRCGRSLNIPEAYPHVIVLQEMRHRCQLRLAGCRGRLLRPLLLPRLGWRRCYLNKWCACRQVKAGDEHRERAIGVDRSEILVIGANDALWGESGQPEDGPILGHMQLREHRLLL